jgi:anti-sigma regulatory factor (Ser/Thr protein kinase)
VRPPDDASDSELRGVRAPLAFDPFEVGVAPDRDGPRIARAEITRWLSSRMPDRVLDDARLLVTELVTNSIRHAGLRGDDVISVRAEVLGGRLRLEVEDAGRAGPVARRTPERGRMGGFGLNIVETLGLRWGVSLSHGTTVWAEMALS